MLVPSTAREIDASLEACARLALEAILSLASALLLLLLASVRVFAAIATLTLAFISFILWCLLVWSKGVESLHTYVANYQTLLRMRR